MLNQEKIGYEYISHTPQPSKKLFTQQLLQRSPSWHPNLTSTPFFYQKAKNDDVHRCRSNSTNYASSSMDSGFCSSNFGFGNNDYESGESCSSKIDEFVNNDENFTKIKQKLHVSDVFCDHIDQETTECVLNIVLKKILPLQPNCLIGRKIGEDYFDLIENLAGLNCYPALNLLFSYMNDVDLVRCASVSKTWRKCLQENPSADHRLKQFLHTRRSIKEGLSILKKENSPKKDDHANRLMTRNKPLNVIQNLGNKLQTATVNFFRRSPNKNNDRSPPSKYEAFVKEAKKLKNGERLTKCPLCNSPAKVSPVMDKGFCSRFECSYEFCTRCRGPFHTSFDDCTIDPSKENIHTVVGSDKSKKNLRRLFK